MVLYKIHNFYAVVHITTTTGGGNSEGLRQRHKLQEVQIQDQSLKSNFFRSHSYYSFLFPGKYILPIHNKHFLKRVYWPQGLLQKLDTAKEAIGHLVLYQ